MFETAHIGYNTVIKTGSGASAKTFAGVTQDDLTLSAVTKESITKADAGTKRVAVTRIDTTFKVAGICSYDSAQVSRKEIVQMVYAKAEVDFTYLCSDSSGSFSITGKAICVGYSETTPADGETDPTYSLDLQVTGDVTIA